MIIVVVLKHVSHHVLCGHSKRLLIIVLVNREKKGLTLVGVVCGDTNHGGGCFSPGLLRETRSKVRFYT
jgi:hypothetical protein